MTPSYLFESEGLVTLARFVVAHDTLFAFDLDGTLAPIVDDYNAAQVSEPIRTTLERLVSIAKVAVITGRSREDALSILGFEPQLLVGNHGGEWPSDNYGQEMKSVGTCLNWAEHLNRLLHSVKGVEIEFKRQSISIHYRKATNAEKAIGLINAAIEKLNPHPKRIGGKYVVNLLPMESITKGDALMAAMARFGSKRAIYFGDDETDEEVFKLKQVDLIGIHIGNNDQTTAPYYLNNQTELLGLLNSMVGILEAHHKIENSKES
jgi:trehalose 6-phosphate phosphatase